MPTLARARGAPSYAMSERNYLKRIHIKKLDGQKEEFSLEPSDSVMKVKEMLAEKTGVHKDQIRLIFKGKPMNDEKTLAEQQVAAGATVHMIMQMRGGY